jgi:putative DNA-invertase from lambdoid prophage Rac
MHIPDAIAEFERARIAERVRVGLQRARAQGKRLGRPARRIQSADLLRTEHMSIRTAAKAPGARVSAPSRTTPRSATGPSGVETRIAVT